MDALVLTGLALLAAFTLGGAQEPAVNTGTLLDEMADLDRLARWPAPPYRTIQFSSYDRRSTTPEAPGWFSNADGFGGEPIPGFLKVLREPGDEKDGLYSVADVRGPGAIVRGWSAGMGGKLRVTLDPDGEGGGLLIWDGKADDFLCRRSSTLLKEAGLVLDDLDAFRQEDADYLPIPFARGLKVTYEGPLNALHFYHLQVRLYPEGTHVRSFDRSRDLKEFEGKLRAAIAGLSRPSAGTEGEKVALEGTIEPGKSWVWTRPTPGPGAVRELKLRLESEPLDAALRGCLLRIAFDGSQRPQVEAPVGDFFASGPVVNPFIGLPFTVAADGGMTCRFVMPFARSVRLEIVNHTQASVRLSGSVLLGTWAWDDRSLYFRAKWRADHDLAAGVGVIDLPYLVALGRGVFVGCAAMIVNPSGAPMAAGNWWGEGDEKLLVDGETVPSTFGTGSEDYFNYSWSRPDLFSHPYCGQPLDSGPDTSGYVSNHRFQIMDAIPFERSLAFHMELWTHNPTPGLSYARIAYHYARPDAVDDHRALMPSDLKIPALPKREPRALGAASGARFYIAQECRPEATAGRLENALEPLATQLRVVRWAAVKGARMKLRLPIEKDGRAPIKLVAVHRPGGAVVRAFLDGQPVRFAGRAETVALRSAHAVRVLNVHLAPVEVKAGTHELALECVEEGVVGLDYIWVGRY